MPSGKKNCPSCNKSVSSYSRICQCGHKFERKFKLSNPDGTIKRGKQCPACPLLVGARSYQCKCGHVFDPKGLQARQERLADVKKSKASVHKRTKGYNKEKNLEDNDDGNDSSPLKIAPPPEIRSDFPDPPTSESPEVTPFGILESFGIREILRTMIQSRKGSQASYATSHVETVKQFIEFLAKHGYFMIRMKSRHDLGESINHASSEWRMLRRKYGIDRDPDQLVND